MKEFAVQFAVGAQLSSAFSSVFGTASGKLASLGKSTAELKQQQSLLDAQYRRAQSIVQSYANSLGVLSAKQKDLQAKQAALNAAREQGTISEAKYTRQSQRISAQIQQTTRQQEQMANSYRQAQSVISGYSTSSQSLNQQLAQIQTRQMPIEQAMAFQSRLGAARDTALGVAVALGSMGAALAGPIQQAMTFESAMADVRKVVDFDSPQQFKDMSNDILNLSTELPMTAEGIAQIVAAGGQSGIARDELLGFAEDAAKMGVAFDITADQAGDMMAKWRTAFKLGQTDVVALADKINYLSNNTAASAPIISDIVTRIGPLGDVGGIASGEIAALGASMAGVGIPSEIAATGIKNLMLGMVVGESATKSQAEAFDKLGFSTTDLAKKMQVDAKGAILDVMKALQALPKEEQASTLSNLFGKESIGAIAPLLSNLDNLQKNFDMVANSSSYAGSMQAEFDARCQTTENSLQLLKNQISAIGISIGNEMLPYVKSAIDGLKGVAQSVAEFAQANPQLTSNLVIGAGAVLAFTTALAGGAYAVLALIYPFAQLRTYMTAFNVASKISAAFMKAQTIATVAWRAAMIGGRAVMIAFTAAQWVLNAAMTANPIGLLIVGIAALIAIGYALYSNWDTISAVLSGAWDTISSAVGSAVDYIGTGISNFVSMAAAGFSSFIDFVTSIPSAIVSGFTSFVSFLASLPGLIAYGIGFAIGFMTTLPARIGAIVTAIGTWLYQLPGKVVAMGTAFIAAASMWLSTTYSTVIAWITNTVTSAYTFLMQLPSMMMSVGAAFIASAIAWLSNAYATAINWITNTVTTAYTILMDLPSYCAEAGAAFVAAAENWASEAYDSVMNWINQLPGAISDAISGAWEGIKANFSAGFNVGVNVAQNAFGGIYNKGAFLTTFAERSKEAAIPIDGSKRSVSLWQQTGQMLGVLPKQERANSIIQNNYAQNPTELNGLSGNFDLDRLQNSTNINNANSKLNVEMPYNPQVNITISNSTNNSNNTDIAAAVEKALSKAKDEFYAGLPRALKQIEEQKQRVAFS